jgi:hypothetical protein
MIKNERYTNTKDIWIRAFDIPGDTWWGCNKPKSVKRKGHRVITNWIEALNESSDYLWFDSHIGAMTFNK